MLPTWYLMMCTTLWLSGLSLSNSTLCIFFIRLHVPCLKPFELLQQNTINWVAYKNKLFLTALEPEKLKTKFYQKTQCLVRAHFLVHRWPSSCFVLTRQKGRGSPLESLIRTLIPLMRTPPSWPNHLSKTPPPKTIRLRGRFQHMDFGGTQTFSPEHTSRATLYFSWCLP